jgi:hypothetical protein
LAGRRRRRDGILRPTAGFPWGMGIHLWARRRTAATIYVCLIPARDKFPAGSAMWCSEWSGSTDFSLWGLVLRKFARSCARWVGRGLKYSAGELGGRISGMGGGGEDPQTEVCATKARASRDWLLYVAFAFLFGVAPARATTYFVAAGGSDSNNGTSGATPWQTVAKVNGTAFSAGDSILFNRGDAWYGTSLVVPSSGSSGAPITFGAYGSGANPMLKGSTFLSTGGFTLAPNLIATIPGRFLMTA